MTGNLLRQPSRGAHYALWYITVGVVLVIWCGVWFYWMRANGIPTGDWKYYVCTGLLLSGVAVVIIGLLVGNIGRHAQQADVPIGQVTGASVAPLSGTTAPAPTTTNVVPAPTTAPTPVAPPPLPPGTAVTPGGQPVLPAQQVPTQQAASPPLPRR